MEILSKYALLLLCTLSAYTICVLVQIIHPYLLPQNLTHEFQPIGIRFIWAWFCSNSTVCLLPFICKSQLLLQTLLLHQLTLHTYFVILSGCLQASCILLQQLAYFPTLLFVLYNKFHILHLFSHMWM